MNESKKSILKMIKALYLRVIITNGHYHNLNYIDSETFKSILEIIYLIIEDICKNEKVDISNIQNIGNGSYSSVLLIGNKVLKFGLPRITKKFPNNPYIVAILLRKEFNINEKESLFVEVTEYVDTNNDIKTEELYQLYKRIREEHLIWLDVAKRNVGKLYRDNKIYWRQELPINDKTLNLDPYRGSSLLKEGEWVILDNDLIYDDKNPNVFYQTSTQLQKDFEHRYQKEKVLHRKVEN